MPHNGKRMEKNQEKSVLTARKKPFGNIKKGICLMKKIFCTILMLCLVLSLAACGQTNSNNSSNERAKATALKILTIFSRRSLANMAANRGSVLLLVVMIWRLKLRYSSKKRKRNINAPSATTYLNTMLLAWLNGKSLKR